MTIPRALLPLALLLLAVAPLHALVPRAERIELAITKANVAAGRDQALRLELSLKIGDRPALAVGELVSHPTGLARLELQGANDLVERHLLQGSELTVSRNGRLLKEHRAFLPPIFILQADSAVALRAALSSFGVLVDVVGLAECGESDCFVLGDPTREVPPAEPPPLLGVEPEGDEALAEGEADEAVPEEEAAAEEDQLEVDSRIWPKIWVDMESYEVRGIDSAAGVRVRLGPIASFDELRVPAWLVIEEPGKDPARFEVLRASQVNAPASAFTRSWLLSPVISGGEPSEPLPDSSP